MNVASSVQPLLCLRRCLRQKQCISQVLRIQYDTTTAPTRPICLSTCHNVFVNKNIYMERESIWKKAWKKLNINLIAKTKLRVRALYLYEAIADNLNYKDFFEEMEMPDTFNSWFLITELHMWMLMTKSMEFGEKGRSISYYLVESMWQDVAERAKKLGPQNKSIINTQIRELGDQFHAALLTYDEGLLTNDKVLAAALWRRFFSMSCDNPKRVETMVKYVRQQIQQMDLLTEEQFLNIKINWLPLKAC